MKGRPTIILRFKQPAAPPPPEPPSPTSSTSSISSTSRSRSRERPPILKTYERKKNKRNSPPSSDNSTSYNMPRVVKKKVKKEKPTVMTSNTTSNSTALKDISRTTNGAAFSSPSTSASTSSTSTSPEPTMAFTAKRKRTDIPKSIGGGKGDLQPPNPKRARQSESPAPAEDAGPRELRSRKKRSIFEDWFEPNFNKAIELDEEMMLVDEVDGTLPLPKGHAQPITATAGPEAPAGPLTKKQLKEQKELEREQERLAAVRGKPVETINLEDLRKQKVSRTATQSFKTDPLSDDLYEPRHEALQKAEARQRAKLETAVHQNAVQKRSYLEQLNSKDWARQIGLSKALMESASVEELEERRKLLVASLEAELAKYHAWLEYTGRGGGDAKKRGGDAEGDAAGGTIPSTPREKEDLPEQEAREASEAPSESAKRSHRSVSRAQKPPPKTPHIKVDVGGEQKLFKSFFSSRSLRERALRGRQREPLLAFGVQLPEMIQGEKDPRKDDSKIWYSDFKLPEEISSAKITGKNA
ncbi:hypothetical protein FN846DRAFT_896125 [Sphaerosporella brunnea]|uniref:Something about silencing protein 4 domain-containing protein n=1 Tax=Sphaerosporella brunnea TaxID=1250544 RepID=A0A5J5EEA0_9PEZI|nr:hypothetical protein FN846DRAFT_896125 [Sphaerosporella brunnea]